MSAPLQKGRNGNDNRLSVGDVVSGSSIVVGQGFAGNIKQLAWSSSVETSEEAGSTFADLDKLVNESTTLDANLKASISAALDQIRDEIRKGDAGDSMLVRQNIEQNISAAPPPVRTGLRRIIEDAPEASQPIKIIARKLLQ